MPNKFYVGQTDYIEQLNLIADYLVGAGIALTSISATNTNGLVGSGLGSLVYDNTTGVFNYTRPDTYTKTEIDGTIALLTGNVAGIDKSVVGLGNVDNTSDLNKPISTATQTALSLKAPLASPTFTGTVSGISKAMVGLGNVNNTSDADKQISIATQLALDIENQRALSIEALKAPIASPTFTGIVYGINKGMVGLGNVDNTTDLGKPISNLTAAAITSEVNRAIAAESLLAPQLYTYTKTEVDNRIQAVIGAAPALLDTLAEIAAQLAVDESVTAGIISTLSTRITAESPTFTGTVSGVTKAMVGLGNVDNTSDLSKPVSAPTVTAIAVERDRAVVVENTLNSKIDTEISDRAAAISAVTNAVALKASIASPTFTGIVSGITKSMVGLGNTDNIADLDKPVSNATTAAILVETNRALAVEATLAVQATVSTLLALKAPIASPTFTGTVSGVTKAMVGLGNVDNTSDMDKPVSTAAAALISSSVGATTFSNILSKPTTIAGYGITDAFNGTTNAPISILDTTASTAVGTGALLVSGGASIGKELYLGGKLVLTTPSNISSLIENATIVAASPSASNNFDIMTSSVKYFTANAANNFTFNIRGNAGTTLASLLAIGNSLTVAIITTQGTTGYYATSITIDGAAQTVKWANAIVVAGNTSALDVYTYTIIKTAVDVYTVLASRSKFV